jgi:hypothetical protein
MRKERGSQQATPTMSVGTPMSSPIGEKADLPRQTLEGALTHDRIAQLATYMNNGAGKKAWPWRTG